MDIETKNKTFDEHFRDWEKAFNSARAVIRKMKRTADPESRKALSKELKQCDKQMHEAINGMVSVQGHY
jgi:hypothetical protein